jgi:hypothetical protein
MPSIKNYISQKRKSVKSLLMLVDFLNSHQMDFPDLMLNLHVKLQDIKNYEAFSLKLTEVFDIRERHYANEMDSFSLADRVLASKAAIEMVSELMMSSNTADFMNLQKIIWRVVTSNSVSLVWFVVFETPSCFFLIWISNSPQWCCKVHEMELSDLLIPLSHEAKMKHCIKLPIINTNELQKLLVIRHDVHSKIAHRRFKRHLLQLRNALTIFRDSCQKPSSGSTSAFRSCFTFVDENQSSFWQLNSRFFDIFESRIRTLFC